MNIIIHIIAQSKMKPVDVKSTTYIEFGTENNYEDSKFKIGDHAKILKFKNIFRKGYKKIKNTVSWTYIKKTKDKFLEIFMRKNCEKQIKQSLGEKNDDKKKVKNFV